MRSVTILLLVVVFLASGALSAATPADRPVAVSFVFPNGVTRSTELTEAEVRSLLHENFGYMIEWWVRGALVKLSLPHVITVVDQQSKAKAVTSINGIANGSSGRWVLYVDGIRSRYDINTQVRQNEQQIRLVYEQLGRPAG